ncbi:RNA-binding protein of pumilio/mpt5 family, partial [Plasmodium cynomolgi strain B]
MESAFLDESCLSDELNHIMVEFPLKDQFDYLQKLHSCSITYEGSASTSKEVLCLPTPLTGEHFAFLLERRKAVGSDSTERSAAVSLCPDVYGSYVAQSVFDLSDDKYKERFTDQFLGQTKYLSLHTYGCRLIQKSLQSLCTEYKNKIFNQLQNDLITYICHQNGNHVIQKCVEVLPSTHIDTIISNIEEYLPFLCSHAYGCRIVQRIYEIGNTNQINRLNEKIVKKVHLIKNRYGNYVIQKCFEHSDDTVRFAITDEIVSDIYKLSSHKYACNIIEKILLKKEYKYKKKIIKKIVNDISDGNDSIITICKDCYGNFMMQKLLTTCRRKERTLIVKTIIENVDKLKDET